MALDNYVDGNDTPTYWRPGESVLHGTGDYYPSQGQVQLSASIAHREARPASKDGSKDHLDCGTSADLYGPTPNPREEAKRVFRDDFKELQRKVREGDILGSFSAVRKVMNDPLPLDWPPKKQSHTLKPDCKRTAGGAQLDWR